MRVGIDLDGVCHDLVGSYRRFLEHMGHTHPTPDPTEWDFCESWGVSREEFLTHLREGADEIFNGEMLAGALAGLRALLGGGHEVHFITHRPDEARHVTYRWLLRHGLPTRNLYFVEHKHEVPVDIHLDDHFETAVAMAEAGVRSFLFDRPWNRGALPASVDVHRVRSWGDFLEWVDLLHRHPDLAIRSLLDGVLPEGDTVTFTIGNGNTNSERQRQVRTPEQHEILGTFLTLLEGPTGDGGTKRSRGEKPSWKVDDSHLAAAYRHLDPSRERYDEDSGCHKYVHAAWRLLAEAYRDMIADGKVPGDPV